MINGFEFKWDYFWLKLNGTRTWNIYFCHMEKGAVNASQLAEQVFAEKTPSPLGKAAQRDIVPKEAF